MKLLKFALISAVCLSVPVAAFAQCSDATHPTGFGAAPAACNFVITYNANGSISTSGAGGTYDGADDTAVGLVNNSSSPISSLMLTSTTLDIFGFEGDGIDAYGATGNAQDNTGYGGPDAYFTNISANNMSGIVNFINAIAPGSSTFFSLEEAIDVNAPPIITPTNASPEPSSLILLGTGALGMLGAARRKFAA